MSAVSRPAILERVEVRNKEAADDQLAHLFCKCGWFAEPRRARCGKAKTNWKVASLTENCVCPVCWEAAELRSCVCDVSW